MVTKRCGTKLPLTIQLSVDDYIKLLRLSGDNRTTPNREVVRLVGIGLDSLTGQELITSNTTAAVTIPPPKATTITATTIVSENKGGADTGNGVITPAGKTD